MRYIGKNRRFIAKSLIYRKILPISRDLSWNIVGPIFLHEMSCRYSPIHDISAIYRRNIATFSSLLLPKYDCPRTLVVLSRISFPFSAILIISTSFYNLKNNSIVLEILRSCIRFDIRAYSGLWQLEVVKLLAENWKNGNVMIVSTWL